MPVVICLLGTAMPHLRAQMWNGQDTLYGNEWIRFDQAYCKVLVAHDGIYRILFEDMMGAGIPADVVPTVQYRLYRDGVEEPLFAATDAPLGPSGFLEFYGRQNRASLDRHLFANPDGELLNPNYSLFNDTAAYFLTWSASGGGPLRYQSVSADTSAAIPPEPWVWFEQQRTFSSFFLKRRMAPEITYSLFNGDGFCDGRNTYRDIAIGAPFRAPDGPEAAVRVRYACELGAHQQRITFNDQLLSVDAFNNWNIVDSTFQVPHALLKADNKLNLTAEKGSNDVHSIALVSLRYARLPQFDPGNMADCFLPHSDAPRRIRLSGLTQTGQTAVLYDLTEGYRLQVVAGPTGVAEGVLPAHPGERHIAAAAEPVIRYATLVPVTFRNMTEDNANFIIISHRKLRTDPQAGGADHVEAYAEYRRSAPGGQHRVAVVDIEQLYDQFAYGVRFHPMAIKNFLQWAARTWDRPEHLLLIGKGMNYADFRTTAAQNAFQDSVFFIPTCGHFGADLPFGMRGGALETPILSIGRLPVVRPGEIQDYLQKVITYEQALRQQPQTIEGRAWSKRVIHNCGGFQAEQQFIRQYASGLENILSNNRFGASVHAFYKTSNEPIQFSAYQQMVDMINEGVALWMIFGHSSAFAVDFDIGTVDAYNNRNRYPVMMINGCFSGRCVSPNKGLGEQFVLAPERGAIAYFASVHYSFIDALNTYASAVYTRAGGADYGRGIGTVIRHAIQDLEGTNSPPIRALLHQYLLQGDPAVSLYAHPGPDYTIDPASVRIDPDPVSMDQGSWTATFDVVNLGEHTGEPVPLQMAQRLPDGNTLNRLTDSIPGPPNRKTFQYALSTQGSAAGINRLLVTLDPDQTLAEQPASAVLNNQLLDPGGTPGVPVLFFANDLLPLYPTPYGIVPVDTLTLRASTFRPDAALGTYRMELDTTYRFDSPLRQSTTLVQTGGLVSWTPGLAWQDSAVYHWRIARDTLVNGLVPWRSQSFVHIRGSAPGWNQSTYGQFRDGQGINLRKDDQLEVLDFSDNAVDLSVRAAYRDANRYMGFQNSYYEGFQGDYGWIIRGIKKGVGLVMLDPITGRFVPNPPGSPWNTDPVNPRFFYWFNTHEPAQRAALMDFLEKEVPDGVLTGLLAFNNTTDSVGYDPRAWAADSLATGKNLFQLLEAQGAQAVRQLTDYTRAPWPYAFIFKKNTPSYPAQDTIVRSTAGEIELRGLLLARWPSGALEMPPAGPALHWGSLHWDADPSDNQSGYRTLRVYGMRQDGQPDTLLMTLASPTDTSLTHISAAAFPRLRVRYDALDSVSRILTPIRHVRILYTPVPEGALAPSAGLQFYADTVQQGDVWRAGMAYINVSGQVMDSILVQARLLDATNKAIILRNRYAPLAPGDTLQTRFELDTRILSPGTHSMLLEVNPGFDQPEQHLANNTWQRPFFVRQDTRTPLLDVTIDGQRIADGDIVSPSPTIVVFLRDDNPYLPIQDTATFLLRLEYPDGRVETASLQDPAVRFIPADPGQLPKRNTASLEWSPRLDADGTYQLRANGRDASGNLSAALDYSIRFQVVRENALGQVMNYPNPFSTSTCFVYTLTGDKPPVQFSLQIMTVSGRVVREITAAEFGPLRVGTHRSDYCWDGRDQFGDQLANGVYLYRVIARGADGQPFPLREDGRIDGFFRNGIGKMVLMR
jgi:hypothetical protein